MQSKLLSLLFFMVTQIAISQLLKHKEFDEGTVNVPFATVDVSPLYPGCDATNTVERKNAL